MQAADNTQVLTFLSKQSTTTTLNPYVHLKTVVNKFGQNSQTESVQSQELLYLPSIVS